jgi:hypothetical protein
MREQRWKKITSKKVFEDRWFKARADACQFPDGRIIDPYYVVELPNWANAVVVTPNNEILLVKQYRYPVDAVTLELQVALSMMAKIQWKQHLEKPKKKPDTLPARYN